MGQLYRPTTTRQLDLNSFPTLSTERLQLRELTANVHPQKPAVTGVAGTSGLYSRRSAARGRVLGG